MHTPELVNERDTTKSAIRQAPLAVPAETLCLVWVHPRPGLTPLDTDRVRLGRAAEQTVCLPGDQVSREHAEIQRRGRRWVLVDQQSKNGCFQNGRRIREAPLADQDVVRLGEWLAVVTFVPNDELDAALVVRELEPGFVAGPALRAAFRRLEAVAASSLNVMLVGETGTGKELFARSLHTLSGRGSLVAVNCAAVPEQLADAQLFGYKKGAFTGASNDQIGLFQSAARGTLFLDELGDLALRVQGKLLRALQEGRVAPLGQLETLAVDVRVVCAMQEAPERAVESGALRADLFARLNGVQILIPPLRARREEVLTIFQHTLAEAGTGAPPVLDPDLAEWLLLYDWPLNAREVVQCARSIHVEHAAERRLQLAHLPPALLLAHGRSRTPRGLPPESPEPRSSATADERLLAQLLEALRETSGNVSVAARKLHISRQRAYRLLAGRVDAWDWRGNRGGTSEPLA